MSLLLPLGLAALLALPVIVVLHMRHTTPRLKPVPTLRFWLAARPERTEQTRLRRPPITLLLLLQLAIAALLGLALARPVTSQAIDALGINLRTEPRHVILILDGSTSMGAADTVSGATRFEEARRIVLDRLATLREGDVATLLVLGTRTSTYGATDAGSLALLRQRVAEISPPGGRANLDGALVLTRDLLLPELDDQVVVVSDGALAADATTVANLGAPVELVLVGAGATGVPPNNVAIVYLAARASPSTPELLRISARVVNFGPAEVSVPVTLFGDTIEMGREVVTLAPYGGVEETSWPLPAETANAMVSIEATDAFAADNVAALVLRQGAEEDMALKILLVADAPSELQRALSSLTGAVVTTESSDNLAGALAISSYDLIVFERAGPPTELMTKLQAPLLFVNPPAGGPFTIDGVMSAPVVTRLLAQDPLLSEVDLGGATFGETPIYVLDSSGTEIAGANEGPLIFRATLAGQPALVFAFDVAQSNLPLRVAFPILIANAVKELAPSPLPPSVPLGDPLVYRPRASAASVRVTPPHGEPVELSLAVTADRGDVGVAVPAGESPDEQLREVTFADTGQAGVYAVTEIDASGEPLGGGSFVVNAGHPSESDLRANPALPATLAATQTTAESGSSRTNLTDFWPLLATIALVLLTLEWIVAMLPRRAVRLPASAQVQLVATGPETASRATIAGST